MDYRVCVCVLLHIPSYNYNSFWYNKIQEHGPRSDFTSICPPPCPFSSYFDFNLSTSFSQFRPNICRPKGTIRLYRKTCNFTWNQPSLSFQFSDSTKENRYVSWCRVAPYHLSGEFVPGEPCSHHSSLNYQLQIGFPKPSLMLTSSQQSCHGFPY